MRAFWLLLALLISPASKAQTPTVTVEVDAAQTGTILRDLLGVNKKPVFNSQTPGVAWNAASLYPAFGVSQVRLHDSQVDLCTTYTAASKVNVGVTPAVNVAGCTLEGSGAVPHFKWTPTSSADADLDNPENYDFSAADLAIASAMSTGAALYLRLGESYNGPNDTGDPVAWAKVATNIYKHVLGLFKPSAGIAVDPVFVEVFNEPDGGFWRGDSATFSTLFVETVQRVRAAAAAAGKTVQIGGPGFTRSILSNASVAGNPANGFIGAVGAANLDFFSAHHYGSCASTTLTASANFLRSLRAVVDGQGGSAKPLQISEWNIGLGSQCGNDFYAEQRLQSFTSGVLTLMQDPAQNIAAAHFYAAAPIMALFDATGAAGSVRINPSAWALWAHARLRGNTALSAQVCSAPNACVAGYAAESKSVLALAGQLGSAQNIVVTNDGSVAVTYTLRLKGLTASSVSARISTPPAGVSELPASGDPVTADSAALATLLASATRDTRAQLAVSGGQLEMTVSIPARSLQLVEISLDPSAPIVNLSTRGQVQTGDGVMIGGFIIGGASAKTVLIRALGPTLANYGVSGVLADPKLDLYSGRTVIASNDNWGSAANVAAIQASGLAPVNALESVILTALAPGAYTAIVSGNTAGTGVGIVEVYEMDNPGIPFTNISTRGQVLTGDKVMIGGFIIQGSGSRTVLIRAVGPTLANYGVAGVLANPKLDLYSGQTVIASNDDWQSADNAVAIQATGLAPMSLLESAILVTLQPGAYTAIVSGLNGGTGVGIVEVFAR